MDDGGRFVIAWASLGQVAPNNRDVFAQRHGPALTPTVGALTDTPDPVAHGDTITLTATGAADDEAVDRVSFHRETNGIAGLQVGFGGDLLVGTDPNPTAGVASAIVPTTGLGNGTYTYWAQATDNEGFPGAPASTTNTVTTAPAPAVTNSDFLFTTLPQRLRFAFNQDVSAGLAIDDLIVTALPGGPVVTPSGLTYDHATNTATVTFTGVLPDASYRATLLAAGITSPGGTPMAADHVLNFFFLIGDANHDARVNLQDFNVLAANFGQSLRDFTQGDFNYDSVVNLLDFNILAGRFGRVLVPGATGAPAADGFAGGRHAIDEMRDLLG
jgi:hypothetical protein